MAYDRGLSVAEQERLVKLIEECNEVSQAAAKVLLHGYESSHPLYGNVPNRHLLERELGDAMFWLLAMVGHGDISMEKVNKATMVKFMKAHHYVHYQWDEAETEMREASLQFFTQRAADMRTTLDDDPPYDGMYVNDLKARKKLYNDMSEDPLAGCHADVSSHGDDACIERIITGDAIADQPMCEDYSNVINYSHDGAPGDSLVDPETGLTKAQYDAVLARRKAEGHEDPADGILERIYRGDGL